MANTDKLKEKEQMKKALSSTMKTTKETQKKIIDQQKNK